MVLGEKFLVFYRIDVSNEVLFFFVSITVFYFKFIVILLSPPFYDPRHLPHAEFRILCGKFL